MGGPWRATRQVCLEDLVSIFFSCSCFCCSCYWRFVAEAVAECRGRACRGGALRLPVVEARRGSARKSLASICLHGTSIIELYSHLGGEPCAFFGSRKQHAHDIEVCGGSVFGRAQRKTKATVVAGRFRGGRSNAT